MKYSHLFKIASVITLATFAFSASAENRAILYGLDVSEKSDYVYGGLILPFGQDSTLEGEGWRARFWIYDLGYDYERSLGQSDIDADVGGFEAGVGKQWVGDNTKGSLFLSLAYRDTELSPLDHESKVEGGDAGLKIQGEITHDFSENWMVQAMASYTGVDDFDDTWGRFRAGYKTGKVTFGPEIVGLDGPDYDATRLGIFVEGYKIGDSTTAGFSIGAHDGSRGNNGGYLNIGFSTGF